MTNVDLHCHSTVSDGLLAPRELVRRAAANGAEVLALTDHDHLGGLADARDEAQALGIRFIDGVEISVSWGGLTIHIVGLGIDAADAALSAGLASVRDGRDSRAQRMAESLAAIGIRGAYEGALRYVGNPALISRSHFARWLVEKRYARDVSNVFEHYLARGKPGYVEHEWCSLAQAVGWIHGAGGVAVVAHPGRYRMSGTERDSFFSEFRALGGEAVEVVAGAHDAAAVRDYAHIARRYGLAASRASDFHGPGESVVDVGRAAPLPPDLEPVWERLAA
jgi:predicted metal-dependent phosphoesterase TrpH